MLPVRDGRAPTGADAAVQEARGRVLIVGPGAATAADSLRCEVADLVICEAGAFAPAAWAEGLASELRAHHAVVLPASPDGRDLAGRIAATLGRPCHAWCTEVRPEGVTMTRLGDAQSVTIPAADPFVATIVPRRVDASRAAALPVARHLELGPSTARDAVVLGVDEADPAEVDLAEAGRIVAGGLGLGGADEFAVLGRVAAALGASLGATRPVADLGIVGHERQIGTTGVVVDPLVYLAFGISGAVQHTSGLGHPERIVAVNTDASCPMMARADLAVVADAAGTARALEALLEGEAR